jgi:hypothetical protein
VYNDLFVLYNDLMMNITHPESKTMDFFTFRDALVAAIIARSQELQFQRGMPVPDAANDYLMRAICELYLAVVHGEVSCA